MKKWVWGLLIAVVAFGGVAVAGYNYFLNEAADRLSNQFASDEDLIKRLENIEIPEMPINEEQQAGEPEIDSSASESEAPNSSAPEDGDEQPSRSGRSESAPRASNDSNALQFNSRQDAVKFVMSRFSASEVTRLSKLSISDLTSEEKAELKALAYSRFTPAEIEAVRRAVSN